MGVFEDVVAGVLAKGVNKPTLVVLNLSLLGCILIIVSLLFVTGSTSSELLPHLAVLLFFAVGLAASVNWLVGQLGTVPLSQQREELFGSGATACQQDEQQTEAVPRQAAATGVRGNGRLDDFAGVDSESKKAQ